MNARLQRLLSIVVVVISASLAAAAEPELEKIDLFQSGTDGYARYRIPGLIVTAKGTVLAYCEARRDGKGDWGEIDILVRRSTDGGKTFSTPYVLPQVDGPKTKNPAAQEKKLGAVEGATYNNAAAFADRDGTVHVLFCLEYMRCFYTRSTDDGVTFSRPVEVTSAFDEYRPDYDWKVLAVGPAHGIQLVSGRLVVPVWLSLGTGEHAHRPSVATTVYSDDHGKTWHRGEIAVPNDDTFINPNETVIVELANGTTMLNVRSESKQHRRIVVFSKDGATKWSKPQFDDTLVEPICMASIVRYSLKSEGGTSRILFANPHNLERADGKVVEGVNRDRRNLTIKLSYDEGKTWRVSKALEPSYSAYSDLAVLADGTALCLYEQGRESAASGKKPASHAYLTLARFNLEWLTDGADTTNALDGKSTYGSQRDDFEVDGGQGFVIHPPRPAANGAKPWIWYAPTVGRSPNAGNSWLLTRLLDAGFYVAGMNVGETYGNPRSREQYEAFYRYVIKKYGLDAKACLLAQSRGGLNHYNFAADHPQWVRCIAGIYTVGDLRSYPGLKRAAPAYGMTPEELDSQIAQHTPVERLAPIAAARIPILHLHGDVDTLVPIEKNSQAIRDRYRELGGQMELIVIPGKGHKVDPLFFESERMLAFLLEQGLGKKAATAASADDALFETTLVYPVAPKNKPNYRIPALVQVPGGDLLALSEKRNDGPGDIGNHDIVLKRSSDRGATWSDEQLLYDGGNLSSVDTTVGVDRETGTLWMFFMRDKKQFVAASSTDSGRTWDGPHSIHEQVIRPEWETLRSGARDSEPVDEADPQHQGRMARWTAGWDQRYGVGPGNAMIQLRSGPKAGRLLVPARHKDDVGGGRLRSFAHTFYSDDHGKHWHLGGTIGMFTSECQLVELADGRVMVMSRSESAEDSPDNLRHLTSISNDAGITWSPITRAEELITPRCHGPVERYTLQSTSDKNRLLFSSPASPFRQEEHPYGRYNLTVRLSYDEGETWSAGKTIWPHPSSYSDIAILDDGTIGVLYERGPKGSTHYWDELHFARFNLQWLTAGRDRLPTSASQ